MWNLIAVLLFIAFVTAITAQLERTHRGAVALPRVPWGTDAGREADLQRVLHDLDARS